MTARLDRRFTVSCMKRSLPVDALHARLRERLQRARATQAKQARLQAWSVTTGLLTAFFLTPGSAVLDGMDIPPPTIEHWLGLAWFGAALLGTVGLLTFGFRSRWSTRTLRLLLLTLWLGDLAAAVATAGFFPFAIALVTLPVLVGSVIVARVSGAVLQWLFLSLPPIALCCRIAYEGWLSA